VEAVENGSLDVAIVWGPIAGYFAQSEKVPLSIAPVEPPMFLGVPFTYGISAGVRPGNEVLRDKLNAILQSQSVAIRQILTSYDVPQSQ
jgi:mxaJ protein